MAEGRTKLVRTDEGDNVFVRFEKGDILLQVAPDGADREAPTIRLRPGQADRLAKYLIEGGQGGE